MTAPARKMIAVLSGTVVLVAAISLYLFFDYARAKSFCDDVTGNDAAKTLNLAREKAHRVISGVYKNERRVVFGTCYCALYLEDTKIGWSRVLCHG